MRALKLILIVLLGAAAAGCGAIQETRLAPNLVRLDVDPPGAPLGRDAIVRRAAEVTLQSGYGAFRLSPIYAEAFNDYGVIVVMSQAGDPAAAGAIDAAKALGRPSF